MLKNKNNVENTSTSRSLLDILVCPDTKSLLIYDKKAQELISVQGKKAYPIAQNVPLICENYSRQIICYGGRKIRITYANYGRKYSSKCGFSFNRNCISPTSLKKVSIFVELDKREKKIKLQDKRNCLESEQRVNPPVLKMNFFVCSVIEYLR